MAIILNKTGSEIVYSWDIYCQESHVAEHKNLSLMFQEQVASQVQSHLF